MKGSRRLTSIPEEAAISVLSFAQLRVLDFFNFWLKQDNKNIFIFHL